jgi:hypothetical protein
MRLKTPSTQDLNRPNPSPLLLLAGLVAFLPAEPYFTVGPVLKKILLMILLALVFTRVAFIS